MKKFMSGKTSLLVVSFLSLLLGAFFLGKSISKVLAQTSDKTSLCHLTSSETNPWVVQDVNANELQSHLANGDFLYTGDCPNGNTRKTCESQWCADKAGTAKVDCQLSEWSQCSATCGGGTQTRTVLVSPLNGGAACGDLSQACNTQTCTTPTCLGDIPSDLLVNVTQGVTNDVDSGLHGYWAFDNYTRQIKVWRLQPEGRVYCADVRYNGTFDVQPGVLSPQNGEALIGTEDGTMTGGRRAQITGSFSSSYGWATTGNVGSYNYNCLLDGSCTDRFSWVNKYFGSEFGYEDLNWGWTYVSCGHGQWVNASTGNSGDIVVGPTSEVCSTPTPLTCSGDQHVDASGTKCVSYELGGPSTNGNTNGQVLGASTVKGQVLGASTMAGTGSFAEGFYQAIMGIGATLSAFGLKGLKKAQKTSKK